MGCMQFCYKRVLPFALNLKNFRGSAPDPVPVVVVVVVGGGGVGGGRGGRGEGGLTALPKTPSCDLLRCARLKIFASLEFHKVKIFSKYAPGRV